MWRNSDAAQAEAIYVSTVSIPTLLMRSPRAAVQQISDLGDADLAMRSVQKVNIQETRRCKRQLRRKPPDYQTPDFVFSYNHVCVSSGDASNHKCRDLSDSPGHASSILLRVASVLALNPKCKDLNQSPGHAEPFGYVILRCGVAIAHVNIIHVT